MASDIGNQLQEARLFSADCGPGHRAGEAAPPDETSLRASRLAAFLRNMPRVQATASQGSRSAGQVRHPGLTVWPSAIPTADTGARPGRRRRCQARSRSAGYFDGLVSTLEADPAAAEGRPRGSLQFCPIGPYRERLPPGAHDGGSLR